MKVPKWLKIFFAIFPFLSLFFLPWPMTLIVSFAAGLVFPPLTLIIGGLVDVLYYPGNGWPLASVAGALLCGISYGVRYFIKRRIL